MAVDKMKHQSLLFNIWRKIRKRKIRKVKMKIILENARG